MVNCQAGLCKLRGLAGVFTEAGAPLAGTGLAVRYLLISQAIPPEALPVNRSHSKELLRQVRKLLDER
jgi:hypothetical protein